MHDKGLPHKRGFVLPSEKLTKRAIAARGLRSLVRGMCIKTVTVTELRRGYIRQSSNCPGLRATHRRLCFFEVCENGIMQIPRPLEVKYASEQKTKCTLNKSCNQLELRALRGCHP